jgi:2-keto-3-deoxy-L-rhamnonate aldolase RhmA
VNENPVKRTLASGGVAAGAMLFEFATIGVPRILAAAGADFALFDQEHTGWSVETLRPLLLGCAANGVVPLARVPAAEEHLVGAALDAGALGLMAPRIGTAAQARAFVAAAKFPPEGHRSWGLVYSDQVRSDHASVMDAANREQLLIALIETADGIANAHEIAAVDGIDVLWIGPNDLSASLGIPGRFDAPEYQEAVEEVLAAARGHGKAAAMTVTTPEDGRELLARGFRCLCFRDISVFERSLRELVSALR